jgi:hypothetical protein
MSNFGTATYENRSFAARRAKTSFPPARKGLRPNIFMEVVQKLKLLKNPIFYLQTKGVGNGK